MYTRRTSSSITNNIMLRNAAATKSDLIELTPFAIQIALASNSTVIDESLLMGLVTNWMTDGFNQTLVARKFVGFSTFQSVLLNRKTNRKMLLTEESTTTSTSKEEDEKDTTSQLIRSYHERELTNQQIFTASYQLYTVWLQQTGQSSLPKDILTSIESEALLKNTKLLVALQAADPSTGLGGAVSNVWAFAIPSSSSNNNINSSSNGTAASSNRTTNSNNNSSNSQLQVIIIVAVVVAGVALSVLSLAVVWAWRQDRKRRDPYRRGGAGAGDSVVAADGSPDPKRSHAPSPDGTGSSSSPPRGVSAAAAALIVSPPPSVIEQSENGGGVYEESLISEDISTSLSAYYRSGLGGSGGGGGGGGGNSISQNSSNNHNRNLHASLNSTNLQSDHFGSSFINNSPDRLNDAASLSSMESYGYSLDGYNSIAGMSLQAPSIATMDNVMPSAAEIRRVIDQDLRENYK